MQIYANPLKDLGRNSQEYSPGLKSGAMTHLKNFLTDIRIFLQIS